MQRITTQIKVVKLMLGGMFFALVGLCCPNDKFFQLSIWARIALVIGGGILAIMGFRELKSNGDAIPADGNAESPRVARPASKTRYP
jgi:hypothetical protein